MFPESVSPLLLQVRPVHNKSELLGTVVAAVYRLGALPVVQRIRGFLTGDNMLPPFYNSRLQGSISPVTTTMLLTENSMLPIRWYGW